MEEEFAVTYDDAAVAESGGTSSMVIFASAAPFSQDWPAETFAPHAPQFAGSLVVSTQAFAQAATGHGSHPPARQISLAGQTRPQAPQFPGSDWRSRQASPQAALPGQLGPVFEDEHPVAPDVATSARRTATWTIWFRMGFTPGALRNGRWRSLPVPVMHSGETGMRNATCRRDLVSMPKGRCLLDVECSNS
jgi:hypothetical protein